MKKPAPKKRILITLSDDAIAKGKLDSIKVFDFVNLSGYLELLIKNNGNSNI